MNRLTVYDPFADVFPELFRSVINGNGRRPIVGTDASQDLRVDVRENETSYVVHADLPGVAKDDIKVDIDGNRVSISAEVRRFSEEKEGEKVLRSERYQGAYTRSFALANEIDEDAASAKYEDGVLELTLPKKAASASRRLSIN